MSSNTKIKFKRSSEYTVDQLDTMDERLDFGEPLLIKTAGTNNNEEYLVLGPNSNNESGSKISESIFFKGMSKKDADSGVKYIVDSNNHKVLVSQKGDEEIEAKKVLCSTTINQNTLVDGTKKYFILCKDENHQLCKFDFGGVGIYIDSHGVMHGAAWNDYAENREYADEVALDNLIGRVVCEDGTGKLKLSREKLQPCPYVVSDTFGVTIGEGNISVAVAGRVLVYVDDEVKLGDCVAAGFNGKAVKMTRQEIINYPDRILGTVIEIPTYDKFNDKEVNGRVWIKVK